MILGGLSDIRPIDEEVTNLVNNFKNKFEQERYSTNKFKPINYRIQIVNGTNYFVKVETDNEFVHLKIYQSLSQENDYLSSRINKKMEDEIKYF